MPLPRIILPKTTAAVYWHADSWLPPKYDEPGFICCAMRYALSKKGLRCPRITVAVNPNVFPVDLLVQYNYFGVFPKYSRDGEGETLQNMLVSLVERARFRRDGCFVVVAKLSQHTEMISRVLGSLIHRSFRVVLVVPEVNVDEPNNFGIYRGSTGSKSLPVWVRPHLFDEALPSVFPKTIGERYEQELERERRMLAGEQDEDEDEDEDEKFFMQLPAPQITTFSMPTNVTTCVFWDVKDYPVPQGLDPGKFYENIKSAVCSSGDVSIYAYGVAEELELLPPSYLDAGITLVKAPADKVSRATVILVDIVLWSMDNGWTGHLVSNIVVISKDEMKSDGMFEVVLGGLINRRCFKVFLALRDDDLRPPPVFEESVLPWETLSAREKKRKTREDEDTVSASHD